MFMIKLNLTWHLTFSTWVTFKPEAEAAVASVLTSASASAATHHMLLGGKNKVK